MMVLYLSLMLVEVAIPRMPLLFRMIRMAIMSVRSTLSETEIKMYGMPTSAAGVLWALLDREVWTVYAIPKAILASVVLAVTVGSQQDPRTHQKK